MSIYLPIAEMSVQVWLFLAMGAAVGFLSGLFGVGGGFLLTPLLMFSGVPAAVAVGTGSAHIVAASVSGAVTQYRRNNVDVKMGVVMLLGGVLGAVLGVQVVSILRRAGLFELAVSLSYVVFLGAIGSMMLAESLAALRRAPVAGGAQRKKSGQHTWFDGLPFKMRFPRSKVYISVVPPVIIGMFVGMLAAVMGVGGGFIVVPAMIYLLRMPTNVVVGTSLFQIVFVAAAATLLHAVENKSVDIVLAALLVVGGVIGTQFGSMAGQRLRGEHLRVLLAALVLMVSIRLAFDLVWPPRETFSIGPAIGCC